MARIDKLFQVMDQRSKSQHPKSDNFGYFYTLHSWPRFQSGMEVLLRGLFYIFVQIHKFGILTNF